MKGRLFRLSILVAFISILSAVLFASAAAVSQQRNGQERPPDLPVRPSPPGPAAPSDLSVIAVTGTSVTLKWKDNAADESGYFLRRKDVRYGVVRTVALGQLNGWHTHTDSWLLCDGREYKYQVEAYNRYGIKSSSIEITATTLLVSVVAPGSFSATDVQKRSITLSWKDNSTNERVFVLSRRDPGGEWKDIHKITSPSIGGTGQTHTWTDSGLSPDTRYRYRVRTIACSDRSASSPELIVSTKALEIPAAPDNLRVTAVTADSISVEWKDNATNERGYKVYKDGRFIDDEVWKTINTPNLQSHTFTGLKADRTYVIKVKAFNSDGESSAATAETKTQASSGGGAGSGIMEICDSSAVPTGWIWTDSKWDPARCGNPSSIVYNVKIIRRYDDLPIGTTIEVCSSAPTPNGWVVIGKRYDSTRCEHPTSPTENVKQIQRKD